MAWHSQNRKRRRDAERDVFDAMPAAHLWTSATELPSGRSVPTNRKYLTDMADSGKIERKIISRRVTLYRRLLDEALAPTPPAATERTDDGNR